MGPLDGIRVLDIGNLLAGPWTGTFLADLGADVIKVEHPEIVDPVRNFGARAEGKGLYWKSAGRNKRCITLKLSTPRGREILLELVKTADVVIENYRAGTMEKWGIAFEDLEQVNPNLVMVRTSGFGQQGPYSGFPGFGTLAEAMSGFANITGENDGPPQLPQLPLADGIAALFGTIGALAGLLNVKNGGGGQWIDNALYEGLMRLTENMAMEAWYTGVPRERLGNRIADTTPRGAYETSEPGKWVALSGSNPATARRIFEAIGRADMNEDPRFMENQSRIKHADLIDEALQDWIGQHTRDEVLATFRAADAPISPIYTHAELLEDPHFVARETHVMIPDADLGEVKVQNVMPRFSKTPGEIRFAGPDHGFHNAEVFGEIGLSASDLDELKQEGII